MSSSPEPFDLPVDLDLDLGHDHDEPHHPHGESHNSAHDEVENRVDPAVAEAVHSVRDRFGAHGLRDLIALAGYELELAERALASLRAEVVDAPLTAEDKAFDVPLASEPGDDDGGAGSR